MPPTETIYLDCTATATVEVLHAHPEWAKERLTQVTCHRAQVGTKMLGELHALRLLLPELEVAVAAGGDEELGGRRDLDVRHGVAVHVAALVHDACGKRLQIRSFVLHHLQGRGHDHEGVVRCSGNTDRARSGACA